MSILHALSPFLKWFSDNKSETDLPTKACFLLSRTNLWSIYETTINQMDFSSSFIEHWTNWQKPYRCPRTIFRFVWRHWIWAPV